MLQLVLLTKLSLDNYLFQVVELLLLMKVLELLPHHPCGLHHFPMGLLVKEMLLDEFYQELGCEILPQLFLFEVLVQLYQVELVLCLFNSSSLACFIPLLKLEYSVHGCYHPCTLAFQDLLLQLCNHYLAFQVLQLKHIHHFIVFYMNYYFEGNSIFHHCTQEHYFSKNLIILQLDSNQRRITNDQQMSYF